MSRLEEQEKVIKASVLSEEEKKCLLNSIRNERRKILICSDQAKWLKDMETQKTFYAWVKPTAKFALSNIFKLLSGTSTSKVEECRLDIVDDGSLLYTSANNNATISFNQKVTLNDWNLISLTMYGSENSSTTYVKMSVNGVCSSASSVPEKVSNIKFFRVCDCAENDVEVIEESSSSSVEETNYTEEEMISLLSSTSSTSLSMPIRVWLVGVGSYDYSNNDIMGIYKVGKKFLNSNLFKPSIYQGTVYYNFGLYKDYEVASLNGTFESSKGRKPIEMVDFDKSYKNIKLRSFFLDNKKFVYGSYDGSLKETMTPQLKQILGYDFDIDSTGKFVLRFKIDSSIDTSSNRTIVSFGNGSSDALRIDLTNNSLIISSFETVKKSVSISITKDEWHSLFIDYSTSKIYVCIDGVRYDGDSLTSISLSSLKAYIGVSKVKNTRLNGLVEMVGYSRTNNSGVVNDILSEAEQLTNEGGTTYHHNIVNALGKVTSKIIENSNNTFETNYSYNSNSNLINLEEKTTGYTGNYLYDSNGNLNSYYTNFQSSSYSYDKLGRLVAEDDSSTQISINYTYDNDGNIKTKEITETNVDDILITYTYDTTIKDRLIGVTNSSNGSNISIQYDSDGRFGYPIKIGNDTLVWEGKNLKSYGNMTFYYNDQGIRYKKVNTTTGAITEYILCGDKVIRMIKGNIIFDFVYDVNDMVIGLSFNGLEYIYDRDIFGNIVGIVDKDNSYIVKYKYDAFGHMTELDASSDTNASIVIENNPFYYKGYLYDVETQLYWVSSRYYSPELCRWISPDSIEYLDPESINGLNLYAYCGNDPINKYDPSGHSAILAMVLIGTLFGAAVGFGFDAGKQLINNGWDFSEVDWGSAVNSAIVGGALGFSLAMGVGYLGPVIAGTATAGGLTAGGAFAISTAVSFGAGALGYATEEWMNGRTPSFGKAMMHGGFVALEGMVNFGVGGIVGSLGNVGTKGKFLTSKEWWGKFIFGLEFTQPFKIGIDYIRKNI